MTWRAPDFDLHTDLFVPQFVTWDPETGEFTRVEGPKGSRRGRRQGRRGGFLRLEGLREA